MTDSDAYLGRCRYCGFEPVAVDAPICPQCRRVVPNPGWQTHVRNIILWIAILAGLAAGIYFLWRRFG